jgi:hypothetical protein
MANKTIPGLPDYGSQDSDKIRKDLLEITKNDGTYASPSYPTGATRKITVEDLKTALAITSQTVTNGVTTKSPSEDAVFDAIYAKGLVKSNAWKNNGVGTFTLEADKYNIVNYSNTNIEILLPAVEVDKTIIVQGTTQDGSGAVNFTINNIKIGGADLGTPYSVTVTNEKEVLIFYGNYYGWHLIGHSNKTIDLSTKLDLDGGNANQDIDIDGFSLNAKHFKVNGTGGAGHIGLKHQSANITASGSESSIGANSVGDPVWKNDGGAIDKLELQSNKTGTVTGNEASTSKYLTVKGVYDYVTSIGYPIPNYYKVNFSTGSNVTGVAGRIDKPFASLQYVWDLIPPGNTTDILIEIEGDYVATTHAIYEPTFVKHNITFTFLNEVTYSVNSTTNSRPLFSFNSNCNNLTFNVPSFTMTKQGSFLFSSTAEGYVFNFGKITALTGIDVSINNNQRFINGGVSNNNFCSVKIRELNISITNDSNNLKNTNGFICLKNSIIEIDEVKITGSPTVSGSMFYLFVLNFKNIYIKKIFTDITYTNITNFKILLGTEETANILIDELTTVANGSTRKSYGLFSGIINKLTFKVLNTLCYQPLIEGDACQYVNLGKCTTNGVFFLSYTTSIINFDSVLITGLSTDEHPFFLLKEGSVLKGNQIIYSRNSYTVNYAIVTVRGVSSSKYITLDFQLINTNQNSTGRVFIPIMYVQTLCRVFCNNLVITSNNDTNIDSFTSCFQPYVGATSAITIEGNLFTNYIKTTTGLTNNADTTIITNYLV